jgi:sugar phosphate isomerase/epimerase
MNDKINRRDFTRTFAVAGIGSAILPAGCSASDQPDKTSLNREKEGLKLSLNAYSFNKPLREGKMTLFDLLDYCASTGFDGVDLTGYYFPGYPDVPPDEFIYNVKRRAFLLGLRISGTGVRNDFTWADPGKRAGEKQLVKDWIVVAAKLGAPLVRIFAGHLSTEEYSWDERAKWIADDIRECADFGKDHGVLTAVQNHHDFLKTSSEVEKMMQLIDSDWNGLFLDIGSYHTPDPYKDISINSVHAVSWQMKEKVFINDTQVDTDYVKIMDIVRKCGFRGYLPLETLGEGDPALKVEALLKSVRSAMNKS